MVIRSKSSTAPAPLTPGPDRDTYIPGDAIPVPEVIEKDSESVWALWSDVVQSTTERYDETQPATLLMGLPELPTDRDH